MGTSMNIHYPYVTVAILAVEACLHPSDTFACPTPSARFARRNPGGYGETAWGATSCGGASRRGYGECRRKTWWWVLSPETTVWPHRISARFFAHWKQSRKRFPSDKWCPLFFSSLLNKNTVPLNIFLTYTIFNAMETMGYFRLGLTWYTRTQKVISPAIVSSYIKEIRTKESPCGPRPMSNYRSPVSPIYHPLVFMLLCVFEILNSGR